MMALPASFVVLSGNLQWMFINLALAAIPYFLSFQLFKTKQKITFLWLVGIAFFIIFLPNAPYVITDIIHFPKDYFNLTSLPAVTLLIVQYVVFFILGIYFFVSSYYKFEEFFRKRFKLPQMIVRIPTFCAIGVGMYLGRELRLNSWDFFLRPILFAKQLFAIVHQTAIIYIILYTSFIFGVYFLYLLIREEK